MEVVLKYVPRDAGRAAMELKVTLPEKAQRRPLRSLKSVVEKAYAKRHGGVPLDDAVGLYTRAGRLDESASVAEALGPAGGEVVVRAPRKAPRREPEPAAQPAPAPAPPLRGALRGVEPNRPAKKRLVRVNIIADPN